MRTMTQAAASKINKTFNRLYKPGDPIIVIKASGEALRSTIKWPAYFDSNDNLKVGIEGIPGGYKLDRIIPVPPSWTRVSEIELPPDSFMLVYVEFDNASNPKAKPRILKAYYTSEGYWSTQHGQIKGSVTHYMPLPAPPAPDTAAS